MTGGTGADVFHIFTGAGVDRVTDFNRSEGDRVVLDDTTAYSVGLVGNDAVITINGAEMILVGVSLSSLTDGWIGGA